MDIIVGAHLYDTRHKNIQVIVYLFFLFFNLLMWSTSKIYGHVFNNTTGSSLFHNQTSFLSKCVNFLSPLNIFASYLQIQTAGFAAAQVAVTFGD